MENTSPSTDRFKSSKMSLIRFSNAVSQSIANLFKEKEKISFVSMTDLSRKGFSRSIQNKTVH
jgi:hypothetical protein